MLSLELASCAILGDNHKNNRYMEDPHWSGRDGLYFKHRGKEHTASGGGEGCSVLKFLV